ncbi:MAG: YbjN domain-containing protein [Faecalicoccus sp.]|nr:YbjN domain-containing protein [Faecalicoccus sp.]
MENTINYVDLTEKALQREGLEFEKTTLYSKTKFNVSLRAYNVPGLFVSLVVDNNDGDVMYRSYLTFDVEKHKQSDIIMECNKLNSEYRFLKMYLDDDGDLCAAYDFVLYEADEDTLIEKIVELFFLCLRITDKCTPHLMKPIWEQNEDSHNETKMKIFKYDPQGETN